MITKTSPFLRSWLIGELTAVFLWTMLAIWVLPREMAIALSIVVGLMLVFLVWLIRSEDQLDLNFWEYTGMQPQDFRQFKVVLLGTLVSLAVLTVLGYWLAGEFWEKPDFWKKFDQQFRNYLRSAFLQQLLLQGYFANRLGAIFEKRWLAALVAGCLFAVAHIPNPVLMSSCLVFGGASVYLFLKSRNIWLMTLGHAAIGTAIKYLVASPLYGSGCMRVGPGFWD